MTVVVFGSINMDMVAQAEQLPKPGATVLGHTFFTASGGKGANQAVAAAKLGCTTLMIGRVGGDVFGGELQRTLAGYGVDISGVTVRAGSPSGVAVIALDDQAENTIIVIPGANSTLDSTDLERLDSVLRRSSVLLVQLEIPFEMVMQALALGRRAGVITVLDPAPARPLPSELYAQLDVITPNVIEAAALVGFAVTTIEDAERAASILIERGVRHAVVKMGSLGVCWATRSKSGDNAIESAFLPAFRVESVDTVAAGDAFNGAMAAALDNGLPFDEAIRWGAAGGALATTRHGAQPSMPNRTELEALLASSRI